MNGLNSPAARVSVHILIVEDVAGLRMITARVLRMAGYQVTDVELGREAMAVLANPDIVIDLLLTDLKLPDIHGLELAAEARTIRPGLRVLFTSGWGGDAETNEALVGPNETLLPKPYTREVLLAATKRCLP